MAEKWQLLPYAFSLLCYIVMLAAGLALFRKWRNRVYIYLAGACALAAAASIGSYAHADRMDGLALLWTGMAGCGFAALQAGMFRLLLPKSGAKLYGHLIAVVVTALTASVAPYMPQAFSASLLTAVLLAFAVYGFVFMIRFNPMRPAYFGALGFYAIYAILQGLGLLTGSTGLKHFGFAFQAAALLLLFVVWFERIVEMMQAATYTSARDTLTGLYNRHYFMRKAVTAIQSGQAAGALMLNIDRFKHLNEANGYDKGDETLQAVSAILRSGSDPIGFAGRFGGADMAVILTDFAAEPGRTAERLRRFIEERAMVTVSVGYAAAAAGVQAEELLRQAEEGLRLAKSGGGNRTAGFNREVDRRHNHGA